MATLTAKQQRFVAEYLIDLNATQAAIRAGYSERTANVIGPENLAKPCIAAAVAEMQQQRVKRTEVDQDRIVRELINILEADPNELVEHRRTCCRFCYGTLHMYQRTANEMAVDREQHQVQVDVNNRMPKKDQLRIAPFHAKGGIGYNALVAPHPKCPECFGQGVSMVLVKDTRNLSPAARALFAGIKQTKDGMQVLTHSKEGFVTLLMRHAGMLNDKLQLGGGMVVTVKDYTGRKKPDAAD